MAYNPNPGPITPEKYAGMPVGPNYYKYGEQAGFVYDPYSDKYRRDPKVAKQYYESQGLIEPEPKTPSLTDTILPIAGTAGAIYGAQAIAPELVSGAKDILGGAKGLLGFGEQATKTLGTGVTDAVGSAGQSLASNEAANAAWNAGADAATGNAGGGLLSLEGIGSSGNAILPIAGAYGAYDLLKRDVGPGRGALQGAASGAAIGSYFSAPGAVIGAGVGGLLGLGKSFFDNPSTKELQRDRWGNLAQSSNPVTSSYAKQYLEYLDSDQAKEDAKLNFSEMKESGQLTPEDVWGGHGMFTTFGDDWLGKYSEQQRRDISQRMLDEGLIDSKKGDLVVTNSKRAKEIAAEVSGAKK